MIASELTAGHELPLTPDVDGTSGHFAGADTPFCPPASTQAAAWVLRISRPGWGSIHDGTVHDSDGWVSCCS